MSGIVGIINLDGAPVDRELLERMTAFMAYRGPDAQNIWVEGAAGFGHTLLSTTYESVHEHQPYSLDGKVWITADARIDGREDLIEKLGEKLRLDNVTDVELILRAYQVWGEDCVQHLIGDFAFAIWDGRDQRLFCARDQFGVKPFYYAQVGKSLVFSNTLNCVRLHPDVSDKLNERAIGDFLLFDRNQNPETTTFADIQRLPGAYTLTLSDGVLKQQRYWNLPVPEMIRYKQAEDYVEHFQELMGLAVTDRLRTEKVGILFSGGLDSTTIAATAVEVAGKQSGPLDLQAFTTVYDSLIPDRERYYSGLAAEALKIPIHHLVADDYKLYEGWERSQLHTPEPSHNPLSIINFDQLSQVAAHSRVVLCGHGGDDALRTSTLVEMLRGMSPVDVLVDMIRCVLVDKLRPTLGTRINVRLKRWRAGNPVPASYPNWLNESFAARLNLPERWQQIKNIKPETIHPRRSNAYSSLVSPFWYSLFESYDPGVSTIPVELRVPFFDVRLLDYLLALPPLPWTVNKQLIRVAMHGKLHNVIRQRPKAPLAGSTITMSIVQGQQPWQNLVTMQEIDKFVNVHTVLQEVAACNKMHVWPIWESLRSVSLGYWLKQRSTSTVVPATALAYPKILVRNVAPDKKI